MQRGGPLTAPAGLGHLVGAGCWEKEAERSGSCLEMLVLIGGGQAGIHSRQDTEWRGMR